MKVRDALDQGIAMLWVGTLVQETSVFGGKMTNYKGAAIAIPVGQTQAYAVSRFETLWKEELEDSDWERSKIYATPMPDGFLDDDYGGTD